MRVICVGTDRELVKSRRLVLQSAGYDAICATLSEAPQLLLASAFDAMIISMTVVEDDRASLRQAAGQELRMIQLENFTDPPKLLALLGHPRVDGSDPAAV